MQSFELASVLNDGVFSGYAAQAAVAAQYPSVGINSSASSFIVVERVEVSLKIAGAGSFEVFSGFMTGYAGFGAAGNAGNCRAGGADSVSGMINRSNAALPVLDKMLGVTKVVYCGTTETYKAELVLPKGGLVLPAGKSLIISANHPNCELRAVITFHERN